LNSGDLVLGRYRVLSQIGSGGFGSVFRVFDLQAQNTVALKLIQTVPGQSQLAFRRFEREVEVMAEFSHPNIVPVLANHLGHRPPFVVLEFINGDDLSQQMKMGISCEDSLLVLSQVAEALDYAHENGIIHRDIKPGNIVLEERGFPAPHLHAWVIDFGILRRVSRHGLEAGNEFTALTRSNATVGTPQYMAPEQWSNDNLGPWTDLYSLGVLAHEMLLGKLPFGEETVIELFRAHTRQEVSLPYTDAWGTPLSPSHQEAFLRSLAKDPEDRYGSCMEFINEIHDAYESEQTHTQKVHGQYEPHAHTKSSREGLWGARKVAFMGVVIAILGGVWLLLSDAPQKEHPRNLPQKGIVEKQLLSPRSVPRRMEEAEHRIPRELHQRQRFTMKKPAPTTPPLAVPKRIKPKRSHAPVEPPAYQEEDFKVEQFLD